MNYKYKDKIITKMDLSSRYKEIHFYVQISDILT